MTIRLRQGFAGQVIEALNPPAEIVQTRSPYSAWKRSGRTSERTLFGLIVVKTIEFERTLEIRHATTRSMDRKQHKWRIMFAWDLAAKEHPAVTAAAARIREAVKPLAFPSQDSKPAYDMLPVEQRAQLQNIARENGAEAAERTLEGLVVADATPFTAVAEVADAPAEARAAA